ncbi:MAG: MFS transporter [Coriobacteriia bacterium]|nr:MFS transporter [Coriobacteriia bacterium]
MTPNRPYTSRRVIFAYVSTGALFTLAASMIWAINTIFLINLGHLTLFQVMLVNTAFLISQALCEVPTGVIADTIGRRTSFLLAIAIISISTVLYVVTPQLGWGFWGFTVGSVLLGVGFTFQTGAVDAWMVDALDATGWEGPKDVVFARLQQASGAALIVGALAGGLLGQLNLMIPYLVRAGVLILAFILVLLLVHDYGFVPRPLHFSTFGEEAAKVLRSGTKYGWRSPVVRPLMFVSAVTGVGGMFVFYSWQPFILQLLGDPNAIWLLGVVQSVAALITIAGAGLVGTVMRSGAQRRSPARVLALGSAISALGVFGIAAVGLLKLPPGVLPAAIAIGLWFAWSLMFGLLGPVRSGFINEHIPSAQRATVLSLDSLFGDAGGSVGQPILGLIATSVGLPIAWAISSVAFLGAAPLYMVAGKAADEVASAASAEPHE